MEWTEIGKRHQHEINWFAADIEDMNNIVACLNLDDDPW